jgi:hypothetical protein
MRHLVTELRNFSSHSNTFKTGAQQETMWMRLRAGPTRTHATIFLATLTLKLIGQAPSNEHLFNSVVF